MERRPLSLRIAPALLAGLLLASSADAQTVDAELVVNGLNRPTWVGSPPGDSRIFVLEQHTNLIKIVENGSVTGTFLNLSAKAQGSGAQNNERGLLGMAFHPDFANNGYFFVNYTAVSPSGATKLERYKVLDGFPNEADPSSAKLILQQSQPFQNHNAGELQFGPDGYLYVAFGDGGNAGDPQCRAQNPGTWLGKMLRIDVDVDPAPYAIPPDNPWAAGGDGVLDEIWHFGLRNPWRYSFDPLTGDLYIGDVGQDAREEFDVAPGNMPALNFGWKIMEANNCYSESSCAAFNPPGCASPLLTDPVWDYGHTAAAGFPNKCTIIGGSVYRGCKIPELQGQYWLADYCSGQVWTATVVGGVLQSTPTPRHEDLFGGGNASITTFGVDGEGEILIAEQSGQIWRVIPQGGFTDCNGNSQADGCEIAADPVLDLDLDGGLDACQQFSADVATVSISAGGTQNLFLHPDLAFANMVYWMVGSTSGTSPGLMGDGHLLPLNPDDYFSFTLGFPNIFPLVNSLAVLDGNAEATAGFFVPAGVLDGSLVGLTFHHAYAVLALGPITVVETSNPIPVTLTP